MPSLREAAAAVSRSRREFLRDATGACLGAALLRSQVAAQQAPRNPPRMTERSMNDALQDGQTAPMLDAQGALVDADMGAYYTWLNQSRLTGAKASSFVAWFENHSEALVISPSTPRGVQSDQRLDLNQLLDSALR